MKIISYDYRDNGDPTEECLKGFVPDEEPDGSYLDKYAKDT
jgi:hypothetical protein